jgi:hypothetical protein
MSTSVDNRPVPEAAPTLVKLEAEISVALTEHHDAIVHQVAIALVTIAVQERAASNGNGNVTAPKLCTICRVRLAADQRTICHTCRRRQRNERERLRDAHAAELERVAAGERAAFPFEHQLP